MDEPSKVFAAEDHDYYVQLFLNLFKTDIGESNSCVYAEVKPQLEKILQDEAVLAHHGVVIDSKSILQDDVVLGHLVLRHPRELLKVLSDALIQQQELIFKQVAETKPTLASRMSVKPNLHARIQWLPSSNRKRNVSSIRAEDAGTFLQFGGTITRAGEIKVLEAMRVFECNNPKCTGVINAIAAVNQIGSIIEKPSGKCPYCKKSSSYTEDRDKAVCHDYQEVKVQEQVQKLGMGSIPRSIVVLLMHDLVDTCKPGDDVVITGVPIHRWAQPYKDERCRLEAVILANTVHVVNTLGGGLAVKNNADKIENEFEQYWLYWNAQQQQPFTGRNQIVSCVCPQLCGLFLVKLTVLLTLIGSPPFVDQHGNRVRGQPHLLLIGDPGTGKSQFLRFAARLSPRSVQTTGVGTTSAGLTCTAVREGSDFVLEAGALVLADRGLCCIDEFGSIRSHERSTILEAMEQQTLSVAKAGIVCTLNTRTTIIAACNPKGKYDPMANIVTNVGIETPLLSRFDLVLILLDVAEERWDRTVSEHLLATHMVPSRQSSNQEPHIDVEEEGHNPGDKSHQSASGTAGTSQAMWDIEMLQAYIAFVKKIEPVLSDDAGTVLTAYYKAQRNYDLHMPASGRTTLRLLESLIRISKSHARLMARDTVVVADAVTAVFLVELSMNTFGTLGQNSVVNYQQPNSGEDEFYEMQEKILRNLKLEHLTESTANDDGGAPPTHASGNVHNSAIASAMGTRQQHNEPNLNSQQTQRSSSVPINVNSSLSGNRGTSNSNSSQTLHRSPSSNGINSQTLHRSPPSNGINSQALNSSTSENNFQASMRNMNQENSSQRSGKTSCSIVSHEYIDHPYCTATYAPPQVTTTMPPPSVVSDDYPFANSQCSENAKSVIADETSACSWSQLSENPLFQGTTSTPENNGNYRTKETTATRQSNHANVKSQLPPIEDQGEKGTHTSSPKLQDVGNVILSRSLKRRKKGFLE